MKFKEALIKSSVQDDGKYASKVRAEPSGVI